MRVAVFKVLSSQKRHRIFLPSGDDGFGLLEEVVSLAHLSRWSIFLWASSHPVIPRRTPMMTVVGELYGFTTETSTPTQLSPQDIKG